VLGISEYGKGELQSTAFAVFLLLLHNNPILINRLSLSLSFPVRCSLVSLNPS
jgi:hypothetical protein